MRNKFGKAKPMRGKSVHMNKHRQSVSSIIDLVLKSSDIILEVLDSRFIEKTRNPELEKKVKRSGKPLIYVFNKADLVNLEDIEKNQELQDMNPRVFLSSKEGEKRGKELLMEIIEKEAKKIGFETINIGVIGYPNTGKSSMINFLTGRKVSRTSSEAGYTRGAQKIKIADGIYLIDTPGIIPLEENTYGNPELMAKHAQIGGVTWDKTRDPEMIINRIVREYPGVLEKHYEVDAKGDSEILIEELGKKFHYMKKGNQIDETRTAKQILKEWQQGKIKV